jgi:hypothetical protein
MVALAKFMWAVTSYGGEPSVEVFAKNYCLYWQKKVIGGKMKSPDPLGLKCDIITSPKRLVTTFFTSNSIEFE